MKGSQKVIDSLNKRLAEEFGAIHQYTAHESYARVKGYDRYAEYVGKRREGELEHVKEATDRIVFLGGTPIMDALKGVDVGINGLSDGLERDDKNEEAAIKGWRETCDLCLEEGDFTSFQIASHILGEEEEHKLGTEANLTQFEQMGEENWLSLQVG